MTRPRPNVPQNYRVGWQWCSECLSQYYGVEQTSCPTCLIDKQTPWREVPRTGRWFVYGLLLLALLFLLRVAGDLVMIVKGWLP